MSAYELRIYEIAEDGLETVFTIFRELVVPMLPDYRIKSFGYWASADGRTLNYVVEHESLDAIEGNWKRFHADPRWKPGLAAREGGRKVVMKTSSVPLVGIAGLPPLAGR